MHVSAETILYAEKPELVIRVYIPVEQFESYTDEQLTEKVLDAIQRYIRSERARQKRFNNLPNI